MTNDSFDNSTSEKLLKILEAKVNQRYEYLIDVYIKKGPFYVKELLGFDDLDFKQFFDVLVFDHNLIKKIVMMYFDFFVNTMSKFGPHVLRRMLNIENLKYDYIFEDVMDLVGISTGAIVDYVKNNKTPYKIINSGNFGYFRTYLCLKNKKYDDLCVSILKYLIDQFVDGYSFLKNIEDGLKIFDSMNNSRRGQRALKI